MSAQGVDERMINVHYYFYYSIALCEALRTYDNMDLRHTNTILI